MARSWPLTLEDLPEGLLLFTKWVHSIPEHLGPEYELLCSSLSGNIHSKQGQSAELQGPETSPGGATVGQ